MLYSGDIAHLRAAIRQFRMHHENWKTSNGRTLHILDHPDIDLPTRATWMILCWCDDDNKKSGAGIEAYEQPDGKSCWVEFWDGYNPIFPRLNVPPIGDDVVKLSKAMTEWIKPRPALGNDDLSGLTNLEQEIIKTVKKLEPSGIRITDELVAMKLSIASPKTGLPYGRERINTVRNELRGKGYKV